jgi:hypothetical protein
VQIIIIKMANQNKVPMNIRVYFHIPFKDKEIAKNLGCRWDPERRKWYCIDSNYGKSNIDECCEIWNFPEPYKIINDVNIKLSDIPDQNRGFTT